MDFNEIKELIDIVNGSDLQETIDQEDDRKLLYKHGILAFERMKLRGSAEELAERFLEMPACPCCASVLFVIASIVGFWNSWVYSIIIFLSFAIGQSMPILLIGSSTSLVKHLTPKVKSLEKYTQFVAGNILIVIALFFFILA